MRMVASEDSAMYAGVARVRHTLQALQARAQAAISLADKGPTSLVQTLSSVLPPLANSGMPSSVTHQCLQL